MRRRKYSMLVAVLVLAVVSAGCPKGAYHDAVVAEHQFKEVVKKFQQAEIIEFKNGRIDATEHQAIEDGIGKIGVSAQILVASLQSGAGNTTVQQNFDTVSAAVTGLLDNGVLGIKNDTSKAVLKTSLQTAGAILANVSTLLHLQTTTTLGGS